MGFTDKKVSEYEKKFGVFFNNAEDSLLDKKVTTEEFHELVQTGPVTHVDYKQRIDWLKNSGYKDTRENLMDSSLPTRLDYESNSDTIEA